MFINYYLCHPHRYNSLALSKKGRDKILLHLPTSYSNVGKISFLAASFNNYLKDGNKTKRVGIDTGADGLAEASLVSGDSKRPSIYAAAASTGPGVPMHS